MTTTAEPTTRADTAPSFDVEAEQAIIGCLLLAGASDNPDGAVDATDGLTGDAFYRPTHGELFTAMLRLHAEGNPFGAIAVAGVLADTNRLGPIGGAPYLHTCIAAAATVPQLGYYRDRVLECAQRRDYQEGGVRLAQAAASGLDGDQLAQLAAQVQERAASRRQNRDRDLIDLGSLINPALDDIETRKGRPQGIRTGYTDLDRLFGGMRRKELILFAGATGMGKSIALVDVARRAAIGDRLVTALFSLEMDRGVVFDRILAAEAGVPHHRIRDGELDDNDWARVSANIGPMANAPLWVSDRAPLRIADIHACCRRLQRTVGLDLVIIDHLHLLLPSNDRITDATAQITDIANGAKQMGMSLDVPVLAAAQFNRANATRLDKRPQMTDLRGAAAIEQAADKIVLIHRPEYYDPDTPRRGEVDLIAAKNRNGAQDVITVAAQLHFSRFLDMAIA